MVDIFVKPTIQQVEELRGQLGDPFLYFLMNGIIRRLNESKWNFDCIATWKCLTRQMFINYSANEVYGMVEKCLEEASNKQWLEHKYPRGCWNEKWKYNPKRKSVIKINLKRSQMKKLINDNIKITDVAKEYGLKIKNKMAICPFHTDTQMSLSLSDEKNIFYCFGCHAKGDIVEFKRRLKRWEKEKMQKEIYLKKQD